MIVNDETYEQFFFSLIGLPITWIYTNQGITNLFLDTIDNIQSNENRLFLYYGNRHCLIINLDYIVNFTEIDEGDKVQYKIIFREQTIELLIPKELLSTEEQYVNHKKKTYIESLIQQGKVVHIPELNSLMDQWASEYNKIKNDFYNTMRCNQW